MEPQLLEQIVEKLKTFPDQALREILNHVDLLEPSKASTKEPLLAIAGTLSGSPITSQEIDISQQQPTGNPQTNAWDILESLAGTVEAPPDWSSEHDHYLYGTPKHQNIEE